ncbi:MAG: GNAT family N-acetyltransferase [Lautropia sp.]
MTSVAGSGEGLIRPLTAEDLPDCLALSRSANWNQNAADWSLMLREGRGWGIEVPDLEIADPARGCPALAGSIIALPFHQGPAGDFAWLSMVLVLPAASGRGLATRLLNEAVGWLRSQQLPAVLDATPQGLPVYTRIGMAPHWTFRRYRREAIADDGRRDGSEAAADNAPQTAGLRQPTGGPAATRPIAEVDWPVILAADRPAFGASREAVLRDLARRKPVLARILYGGDGRLRGYVFGRDGREATQIGPLWAADDAAAHALLDAAIGEERGPLYLDLADRHRALLPRLTAAGFAEQRPFTRMTLDTALPPGDPAHLALMAGPELG